MTPWGRGPPTTPISVLGGSGFIGSRLAARLQQLGIEHSVPERSEDLRGRSLGCVVYCIGTTADFRQRPLDTVDAHVCYLAALLRSARLDRLVYLSSTRVYRRIGALAREGDALSVNPSDPEDLYDLSKAMGEAIAFAAGCPTQVVRLSNVYGGDTDSSNFLASITRAAVANGGVLVRTAPDSEKDYVSIVDVVDMLINVLQRGRHRTYNLASGTNVAHRDLLSRLQSLTGCEVRWAPEAPSVVQPQISIARLEDEFRFRPASVLDDLDDVVAAHRADVAASPRAGEGMQ